MSEAAEALRLALWARSGHSIRPLRGRREWPAMSEAAWRPFDSPFGLAQGIRFVRSAAESNGGGGGSRTRVRKYVPAGLYMRVRFWIFVPACGNG